MVQVLRKEVSHVFGHVHGLFFEGFTHTATAPIDGRADTNFWEQANQTIPGRIYFHILRHFQLLCRNQNLCQNGSMDNPGKIIELLFPILITYRV